MPRDGRYIAKSQGRRCDECPGMGGISQRAREGGAAMYRKYGMSQGAREGGATM